MLTKLKTRLVGLLVTSAPVEPEPLLPTGSQRMVTVTIEGLGANAFLTGEQGVLVSETDGIASVLLLSGPKAGHVWRLHRRELGDAKVTGSSQLMAGQAKARRSGRDQACAAPN